MKRLPLFLIPLVFSGCAGLNLDRFQARAVLPEGHATAASGHQHYQQGKRQLAAGSIGLAIDAFRQAVRAEPENIDALNGLAVAYDRIGRFDLSRRYYEQALGIAPGSAMLQHNFGYSLALQGKREEGRELMENALASGDSSIIAWARHNLAQLGNGPSPAPTEDAPSRPVTQWIERTSHAIQTLVIGSRSADVASSNIEPRFCHIYREDAAVPPKLPSLVQAVTEIARSDDVTLSVSGAQSSNERTWMHSETKAAKQLIAAGQGRKRSET